MATQHRTLWVKMISAVMMVCLAAAFSGCATTKQLADVEAKADRALQMAQESKAMVEKADNAAVRAEQAADRAEQAASKAENIAAKMEDAFMKKMKK